MYDKTSNGIQTGSVIDSSGNPWIYIWKASSQQLVWIPLGAPLLSRNPLFYASQPGRSGWYELRDGCGVTFPGSGRLPHHTSLVGGEATISAGYYPRSDNSDSDNMMATVYRNTGGISISGPGGCSRSLSLNQLTG